MNNRIIPSSHAERKITVRSHKHSCTPYLSLSPYSWTDGITDGETNSIAARGLEELFFQLCGCVSFLVVAGNSFRCFLPTIWYQLCRCVFFLVAAGNSFGLHRSVFWLWREIVLRCYLLIYHISCAIVWVFWLRREIVFGCTVSKKDSYLVSLIERESASKCVHFIRSNILLLFISLPVSISCTVQIHRLFRKISRAFWSSRN